MNQSQINFLIKALGAADAAREIDKISKAAKEAGLSVKKYLNTSAGSQKLLETQTRAATAAANRQAEATANVGKAQQGANNATDKASQSQGKYFAHIAKTTVQSALINKLFLEFVDVSGQAIKQVDLMNNFPAIMTSLGQSTGESTASMKQLSTYIGKVGGDLGAATSMVIRFTGVTKDVKSATAIYEGLNNALIAGVTSQEERNNAQIQFSQALERGKPDMREWNTLSTVMSDQLNQVAKSMGYVNASALGADLREGKVSMAEFTTELTKLSTQGAIAEQALAQMQGIEFGFNVMKNTLVQGLAAIINAFGRSTIIDFFGFMTQVIRVLTSSIITLINWLGTLANAISSFFGGGKVFTAITGESADNIAKGAKASTDLGNGLKDAKDDAEELNKSLAGFDKMNVLPDKTGKKKKEDDAAGGTMFNPDQIKKLQGIFDGMSGGLEKISIWAKIVAGVLGGIAALKFGKNILDGLNSSIDTLQKTKKNMDDLGKSIDNAKGKTKGLAKGLQGLGGGGNGAAGAATAQGVGIGLAIRNGIIAGLGAMSGILYTMIGAPLALIGATIVEALVAVGAVAATVTVPLWGLIAIGALVVAAIVAGIFLIWKNWDTIWGWIKTAFNASVDFIVGIWQGIYDIFAGPVKLFFKIFEGIFIAIVAIVAIFAEAIFKLWVGAWMLIFKFALTIATWVYDNVIVPVGQFFQGLWDGLITGVTTAWNWIFEKVLRPVGTWVNTNVVQPVIGFFKNLWDTVTGFVSGFFTGVKNVLSPFGTWIKQNVIDPVANFFSGLWDGVKTGLSRMMDGIRGIFDGVGNIFKTPLNGIIDLLNKAIGSVNKLKVPDWVPSLGGKTPGLPLLPRLATGGVIERATVAMVGESGAEAVVPLENNTEWIDKLAAKINKSNGNGQPIQLVVQIGEERILTRVIDLINEKTQMSGRNQVLV